MTGNTAKKVRERVNQSVGRCTIYYDIFDWHFLEVGRQNIETNFMDYIFFIFVRRRFGKDSFAVFKQSECTEKDDTYIVRRSQLKKCN